MVNPGKFQGIIIDKKKCHPHKILKIRDKIIKASSSVKLLGVHSKSSRCSDKKETFSCFWRKEDPDSYFYSNFNYCPMVWMFSSAKSLNKNEPLQKKALCFLHDSYHLWYISLSLNLLEKVQWMLLDSKVFALKFLKRWTI